MENQFICIGDLHGNINELKSLWRNLERELGPEGLELATVVFLGDYVDRGPDSAATLSFLAEIKTSRPGGKTIFLCGNHDLGMAAFLGSLPMDSPPEFDLDQTKSPKFLTGFWPYHVKDGMHYQGRRWAGSHIYSADTTFASYGVPWDPQDVKLQEKFQEAVPEIHKHFLKDLVWVYDQQVPWPPGRLVCAHAGLDPHSSAELQIEGLKARDPSNAILYEKGDPGRFLAMSGRTNAFPMHPDLEGKAVLVSGHHGVFHIAGDRIINDLSGGCPGPVTPLTAILLPSRKVLTSKHQDT